MSALTCGGPSAWPAARTTGQCQIGRESVSRTMLHALRTCSVQSLNNAAGCITIDFHSDSVSLPHIDIVRNFQKQLIIGRPLVVKSPFISWTRRNLYRHGHSKMTMILIHLQTRITRLLQDRPASYATSPDRAVHRVQSRKSYRYSGSLTAIYSWIKRVCKIT